MTNNILSNHSSFWDSREKPNNSSEISQKIVNILDYQGREDINFKVFETFGIVILKWKNYKISTSELNGCTAWFLVFKNLRWVAFVIATHFPPQDFIFEAQLRKITSFMDTHAQILSEITEIEFFLVWETSKYNADGLIISSLVEEKLDIIPANIISYYDAKDTKRANVEDLWTLHLEVFANGNIIVTHEWKTLTQ